jgi:RNA polymerase-binding transcription factor DksA
MDDGIQAGIARLESALKDAEKKLEDYWSNLQTKGSRERHLLDVAMLAHSTDARLAESTGKLVKRMRERIKRAMLPPGHSDFIHPDFCRMCGEKIDERRLKARPEAETCVGCEKIIEKEKKKIRGLPGRCGRGVPVRNKFY